MSNFPPPSAPSAGGPGFPPPAGGPGMGPLAPAGTATAVSKGKRAKRSGGSGSGAPTKRALRTNKVFAMLFAVIAALLLLVVVTRKTPETYVVQAGQTVGANQTIGVDQLQATALPSSAIEQGAFVGSTARAAVDRALRAIGKKATVYPLFAGEQLQPSLFTASVTSVHGTQRLFSISADPVNAVDGAIRPGDRVDIIAVSSGADLAGYVATDILVSAVGANSSSLQNATAGQGPSSASGTTGTPQSQLPGTYVLRVTQAQAVALAMAGSSSGALYLALRGAHASNASPLPAMSIEQALCGPTVASSAGSTATLPKTCAVLGG